MEQKRQNSKKGIRARTRNYNYLIQLASCKRSQEEMVGFALIIVLVAVILLAFLGFSLSRPSQEVLDSYEVEGFLQASLQYTTECGDLEYLSLQDLVFECDLNNQCTDGKNSCEVLDTTFKEILKESWPTGEERPTKGYKLTISTEEKGILEVNEGDFTSNYKGASQSLSKRRKEFIIELKVYY